MAKQCINTCVQCMARINKKWQVSGMKLAAVSDESGLVQVRYGSCDVVQSLWVGTVVEIATCQLA